MFLHLSGRNHFSNLSKSICDASFTGILCSVTTSFSFGLARDIIRHVQAKRKEINFDIESSIKLEVWVDGQDLFAEDWDHIQTETRAGDATLNEENISNNFDSFEVDGVTVKYIVSQID